MYLDLTCVIVAIVNRQKMPFYNEHTSDQKNGGTAER